MLEQEIDLVFKRLRQKVTDPEVACAAIKQLARTHLPQIDLRSFERLADLLFRRYNGCNTTIIASELKVCIRQMCAVHEAFEWLNV